MEISSSARLALAHVDCDPTVAEHDANKSYLLFSAPAPDAGTDRDGHRIRLTPHGALGIPSPLTPSKATFAVSRQLANAIHAESGRVSRLKTASDACRGRIHSRLTSQDG